MFVHRGGLPPIGDADLAPGSYCALAGWAALLNWMMFGRAARCCWGADWGWALLTGMLGGAWAPLRVPGMLVGVELLVFDQLERWVCIAGIFFGGLGSWDSFYCGLWVTTCRAGDCAGPVVV